MRNITTILMSIDTVKSLNSAVAEVVGHHEAYFMQIAACGVRPLDNGRWASWFDGTFDSKDECARHNYEVMFDLIMTKDIAPLKSYIEECVVETTPQLACGLEAYMLPISLGGEYSSSSKDMLTDSLLSRMLDNFDEMFSNISSIFAQPSLSARLMKMQLK